jgi:hypothetical protein
VAGKGGLKAGLIGAALMLVVTLVNNLLLPVGANIALPLISCGVSSLIYVGIGVLAGIFLVPPRTTNKGAGAGAIAGLISGAVAGVVGLILVLTGVSKASDPQQMQQLAEAGINPTLVVIPGAICGLAISTGLGAVGAAIFSAIKPD